MQSKQPEEQRQFESNIEQNVEKEIRAEFGIGVKIRKSNGHYEVLLEEGQDAYGDVIINYFSNKQAKWQEKWQRKSELVLAVPCEVIDAYYKGEIAKSVGTQRSQVNELQARFNSILRAVSQFSPLHGQDIAQGVNRFDAASLVAEYALERSGNNEEKGKEGEPDKSEEEMNVNTDYQYGGDDITQYVDLMVENDPGLGGYRYRYGEIGRQGNLLKQRYLLTKSNPGADIILYTAAIDVAGGAYAIDYFLDKARLERNNLAIALELTLPQLNVLDRVNEDNLRRGVIAILIDQNFIISIVDQLKKGEFEEGLLREVIRNLNRVGNHRVARAIEGLLPRLNTLDRADDANLIVQLTGLLVDNDFISSIINQLRIARFDVEAIRQRIRVLDSQDNYRDVFDEAMPQVQRLGDRCAIKIIFPYNRTNVHWLTGEIRIVKQGNDYQVRVYTHDPFGGGKMVEGNYHTLEQTITRRIQEEHRRIFRQEATVRCSNELSPYNRRQAQGDGTSCGAIVGEDIIKLIKGEGLNIAMPHEVGARRLRRSHIDKFIEFLPIGNATRINFVRRNTRAVIAAPIAGGDVHIGLSKSEIEKIVDLIYSVKNKELQESVIGAISNKQGLSIADGSYVVAVRTAILQKPLVLGNEGIILEESDVDAINQIHRLLFDQKGHLRMGVDIVNQISRIAKLIEVIKARRKRHEEEENLHFCTWLSLYAYMSSEASIDSAMLQVADHVNTIEHQLKRKIRFSLKTEIIANENRLRQIQELYVLSNVIAQLKILLKGRNPNFSLLDELPSALGDRILWNTYGGRNQEEQRRQLIEDTFLEISRSVSMLTWAEGSIKDHHKDVAWGSIEFIGTIAQPTHQEHWIYSLFEDELLSEIEEMLDRLERIHRREKFKLEFYNNPDFQGELVKKLFVVPDDRGIKKDKEYKAGDLFTISEKPDKKETGLLAIRTITKFIQGLFYLEKIRNALLLVAQLDIGAERDRIALLGIAQEIGEYSKHLPLYVREQLPSLIALKSLRDRLGHNLIDDNNGVETLFQLLSDKQFFKMLHEGLVIFTAEFSTAYNYMKELYTKVSDALKRNALEAARALIPRLSTAAVKKGDTTQAIESIFKMVHGTDVESSPFFKVLIAVLQGGIPLPALHDEGILFTANIATVLVKPITEALKKDPKIAKELNAFLKIISKVLKMDFKPKAHKKKPAIKPGAFDQIVVYIDARVDENSRKRQVAKQSRLASQFSCLQKALILIFKFNSVYLQGRLSIEQIHKLISNDRALLYAVRYLATIIGENIRNLEQDVHFVAYASNNLRKECEALKWLRNNLMHGQEGEVNPESLLYFINHNVFQESPLSSLNTVFYFSQYLDTFNAEVEASKKVIESKFDSDEEDVRQDVLASQKSHIDLKMRFQLRKIFDKYGYHPQYIVLDPTLTEADFNTVYMILNLHFKIKLPKMKFDEFQRSKTCEHWNLLVGHVIVLLSIKENMNWVILQDSSKALLAVAARHKIAIKGIFGRLFEYDGIAKDKLGIMVETVQLQQVINYTLFKNEVYKLFGNRAWVVTTDEINRAGLKVQTYPLQAALNTRGVAQSLLNEISKKKIKFNQTLVDRLTRFYKESESKGLIIINMPICYLEGIEIDMPTGTLLHAAVQSNNLVGASALAAAGANVNAQDSNGHTPSHYAVEHDGTLILKCLMIAGANTNIQGRRGSVLHLAMHTEHYQAVELLVRRGDDLYLRYHGKNAFEIAEEIARERNDPRLIEILGSRRPGVSISDSEMADSAFGQSSFTARIRTKHNSSHSK